MDFKIETSKKDYLEGEPICVEHKFYSNDVKIDFEPSIDPSVDLQFIMINSNNDTMKYLGGQGYTIPQEYKHDSLWGVYNLLSGFGLPEKFPDSRKFNYFYIPVGNYKLSAKLKILNEHKIKNIESNILEISVSKPVAEDSLPYYKLIEIQNSAVHDKNFSTLENNVTQFSRFFPNSVYLDKARFMLNDYSYRESNQRDYLIRLCIDEIERNPNNYYNLIYINDLETFYNKEEFKTHMQNLVFKYKNTLIEKIIKKSSYFN